MKNARSLTMLIIALLAGLAAVVLAVKWIQQQGQQGGNKIAVALLDVQLGSRLTPEMLQLVDWPLGSVPEGAFSDPKALDGRVVRTGLARGEPPLESKLAPVGSRGGLSAVVGEGQRAITVRVNDVIGVAGFALPGNYVDIIVSTQQDAGDRAFPQSRNISKIVLERILVLAVAQESNRDDNKPKVVNAVTLELTPDQVEKLDLARSVGTLSLVLRNQIDPAPVNTGGATKESLLGLKPLVPVAAPRAAAPAPARQAPRAPAPPAESVKVITGMDTRVQQF